MVKRLCIIKYHILFRVIFLILLIIICDNGKYVLNLCGKNKQNLVIKYKLRENERKHL